MAVEVVVTAGKDAPDVSKMTGHHEDTLGTSGYLWKIWRSFLEISKSGLLCSAFLAGIAGNMQLECG